MQKHTTDSAWLQNPAEALMLNEPRQKKLTTNSKKLHTIQNVDCSQNCAVIANVIGQANMPLDHVGWPNPIG